MRSIQSYLQQQGYALVLATQVGLKPTHGAQTTVKFEREHQIGQFAVAVFAPLIVGLFEPKVVEIDRRPAMGNARRCDDPRPIGRIQQVEQMPGQGEMGDEIDAELGIIAVFRVTAGGAMMPALLIGRCSASWPFRNAPAKSSPEISKTAAPMIDAISNWGEQSLEPANPRNL